MHIDANQPHPERGLAREIVLRVYVTGQTPSAAQAIATVKALQQELGEDRVAVHIIDVLDDPSAAVNDDIYATPTVVRVKPGPARRMFGNLSSTEMLLVGLQLVDDRVG